MWFNSATVCFRSLRGEGGWKYETDFRGDFRFLTVVVDAYY
jgi:hypothetical protein